MTIPYDTQDAVSVLDEPTVTERDVLEQVVLGLNERYAGKTIEIRFGYEGKCAAMTKIDGRVARFVLGEKGDDTPYLAMGAARIPLELDEILDQKSTKISDVSSINN